MRKTAPEKLRACIRARKVRVHLAVKPVRTKEHFSPPLFVRETSHWRIFLGGTSLKKEVG